MDENRRLGEQPIPKLLFKFAVPCVLGLLIGAFYNIVDQIFIGNSALGYLGNAATGISFPIICIANAFSWCVGDGAASYLSICSGRRDTESAHKCVGTALTTTTIISIVLALVGLAFCQPLMRLFGASDATLTLAGDYFRITALFFPAYCLMCIMNSIIRADGSPNFAMVTLIVGAVLNIVLDPICIFVLDWGIKGAAIASVTGQTASFLLSMVYFFKPRTFQLKRSSFRIDRGMLRNLITLGGSTFIIQISVVVMTLLSNITLSKYGALSIYGGDIPLSAFSIQTKVYTIVNNIAVGIALGGQPILGYNYGAQKMDRVRHTYRLILLSTSILGVTASAVFLFCPELIINIFGKQNPLYMEFAAKSFRICLGLSFVTCFIKISSIFFQSIGKAVQAMIASIIRDLFCFVTFTLVLCNLFESRQTGSGIYGILFAAPLSDLAAGLTVVVLTVLFFKKLNRATAPTEETTVLQPSHPGTVITIARQHGSRGKQVGELVAEKLGVPCYCKDFASLVATDSGLHSEFISEEHEDANSLLRQFYLSAKVVQQGIIAQDRLVQKIAQQGSCVVVGRAADYMLRNHPNVLKVFLYAPEDARIQNIQTMYGDSPEEARVNMVRSDESRSAYYRSISGREWMDMSNYDLCLDTSVGKELAAQTIVGYVERLEACGVN